MIVKASGGVVVRERDDGRLTHAIRRRRGDRRETIVLGGPEDGWSGDTATIAARLYGSSPGPPDPAMTEAPRLSEARARGRDLDRRRRHA
ncbi:MAG: hypothetical protein JSU06_00480 [Actinobacteria bacterium]|nr:hypothetical protein [Actinomycetota bacterium]